MSNVVEIGSLEGRLCGELAAALARRVTANDQSVRPGLKDASFYHDSTTAFEAVTEKLTGLGLLAPVPRDDMPGETWYCLHALTIDANDMPNALAACVRDGDERLPGLLEAFVCLFCHYDELSDGRGPFAPPLHLTASMAMLARAGFAEKAGDAFRWTERIGPAMRWAALWDDDGASIAQTDAAAREANARLAWKTMPETLKHSVRSGSIGVIELTKVLALGWREGRWTAYRLDDWFCLQGEIQLARRIFELAAEAPAQSVD